MGSYRDLGEAAALAGAQEQVFPRPPVIFKIVNHSHFSLVLVLLDFSSAFDLPPHLYFCIY